MEQPTDHASTPRKHQRAVTQQPKSTSPKQEPVAPAKSEVLEDARAGQTEPPIGKRWGEFPPPKRQSELKQRLQAWEQESDHGKRPGPFADQWLSGADVFWLAAQAAGEGNVIAGQKTLLDPRLVVLSLPGLHLEGADLGEAQLQGANLSNAQLQGADLTGAQLQGAALLEASYRVLSSSMQCYKMLTSPMQD